MTRDPQTPRRPGLRALLPLAALALAGCGGGGGAPSFHLPDGCTSFDGCPGSFSTDYAYVADSAHSTVTALGLSAAAAPVPRGGPLTLTGGLAAPQALAVDQTQNFVLVASAGLPGLSSFRIGSDGSLAATPASTVALPQAPRLVAVRAASDGFAINRDLSQSQYVCVAGGTPDSLSVLKFNPATGALTRVPNAAPATGKTPASLAVGEADRLLYVGNQDATVSAYTLNPDGTLTLIGTVTAGTTGPELVAVGPASFSGTGRAVFAYDAGANILAEYQGAPGGALSAVNAVSPPSPAGALAVNATGSALYLTQRGGGALYEYPVTNPHPLPSVPTATTVPGAAFQAVREDAAGALLLTLDTGGGAARVVAFPLKADGTVGAPLPAYALPSGSSPVGIASALH